MFLVVKDQLLIPTLIPKPLPANVPYFYAAQIIAIK